MTVEDTIKKDIQSFLSERTELFFNESDLQMQLSVYLMQSGNYDDVNVEYYIPFNQLDGYLWNNELYIDIVVRRGDEYVAVELKYPTKKSLNPYRVSENSCQKFRYLKNIRHKTLCNITLERCQTDGTSEKAFSVSKKRIGNIAYKRYAVYETSP